MKQIVEFYSLGSASELEGLTTMTRIVDEEGNPLVQYGGGPAKWYKAKQITEEEYLEIEQKIAEARAKGEASFGLLNETGKKLKKDHDDEQAAKVEAKRQKIIAHEAKKLDKMIEVGILTEADVDQELENRGFTGDVKQKIKDKREPKVKGKRKSSKKSK